MIAALRGADKHLRADMLAFCASCVYPREQVTTASATLERPYTRRAVERLLGLREEWGVPDGHRDVTILDLLSWAHDPGGDYTWTALAYENEPDAWTARRGPLRPDSVVACILYDFLRAMRRLNVLEGAIVSLTVFGYSRREIAELLGVSPQRVSRILLGRRFVDEEGRGRRVGGAVNKITGLMVDPAKEPTRASCPTCGATRRGRPQRQPS